MFTIYLYIVSIVFLAYTFNHLRVARKANGKNYTIPVKFLRLTSKLVLVARLVFDLCLTRLNSQSLVTY